MSSKTQVKQKTYKELRWDRHWRDWTHGLLTEQQIARQEKISIFEVRKNLDDKAKEYGFTFRSDAQI